MFSNLQIQPIISNFTDLLHIFLTASIIITLSKINERATLYTKTQYLILILVSFSIPLMRANISNIVPIYILLELGTVLFILLTLKGVSNSHLTKFKKNLVIVLITSIIIPILMVKNNHTIDNNNLWVDLYKTTLSTNEFTFWALPILRLQQHTLKLIVFLISLITLIVIYIKTSVNLSISNKKTAKLDSYLFIKNSLYFTKKNILTFFKAN